MTMTIDQAIDKARKLLALATSDNANESAAAAKKAQAILDRYSINQAMLEADDRSDLVDEPIENFRDKGAPLDMGKIIATWKSVLANVLADVNQCKSYTSRKGRQRSIEIIGRASDVEKVRYLFTFLVRETDRLTNRDGRGCGRTWRNNYRHGVVETLSLALRQARATAAAEMRAAAGAEQRSLVRIDKALVKLDERAAAVAQWAKQNLNLRSSRASFCGNRDAREQGRRAGREIQINNARGALGSAAPKIRGKRDSSR